MENKGGEKKNGFNPRTVLRIVFWFLIAIACMAVIGLLFRWTATIEKRNKVKELRQSLFEYIDENGAVSLFEAAGVDTERLYYSEDVYTYFDSDALVYSGTEIQNMRVYGKCAQYVAYIKVYVSNSLVSAGSGLLYGTDGYIITNNHVISGGSTYKVHLADESVYDATLIGADAENDLAVLKIDRISDSSLSFISYDLKVGQRVFAIGNPLGYTRTLTSGYITGISSPIRSTSGALAMGLIQFDAPLASGNSGGPLLDTAGNVAGICISTYSTSGNYEGMSFAIPTDIVIDTVEKLIAYGSISRGWLDLVALPITPVIAAELGLNVDHGLLVSQVDPNGQAARAGVKGGTVQMRYSGVTVYAGGDVITQINGVEIRERGDVFTALMNTVAGDKIPVTINRAGQSISVKVTLAQRTEDNLTWLLR